MTRSLNCVLLLLWLVSPALAQTETVTVRAWQRSCFGGDVIETVTWVRQGNRFVSRTTTKTLDSVFVEQLRQIALNASQDPHQLAAEWGWDRARFQASSPPEGFTYDEFRLAAAELACYSGDRSYNGVSLLLEGTRPLGLLGHSGLNWTVRQPGQPDRLVFSRRLSSQAASLIPANVLLIRGMERDPYAEDESFPSMSMLASNWLVMAQARQREEASLVRAGLSSQFEVDQAGDSYVTLRSRSGPIELIRIPKTLSWDEVPRTYGRACQVLTTLPWLEEWHAQGERTFMLDLITPVITNPERWRHPSDGWLRLWSDPADPKRQEYAMLQVQFNAPEFLVYMASHLEGKFSRYNPPADSSLVVEDDLIRAIPFGTIDE